MDAAEHMTLRTGTRVAIDLDEALRNAGGAIPRSAAIKIIEAHRGLPLPSVGFSGRDSDGHTERYLVPVFVADGRSVTIDLQIVNDAVTDFEIAVAFPHDHLRRTDT